MRFTKWSRAQRVVDRLAPESHLHSQLWVVRNKLYAHSDEDFEHRRTTTEFLGQHKYVASSHHLDRGALSPIKQLARQLSETFREEQEAREQELRDAGIESNTKTRLSPR